MTVSEQELARRLKVMADLRARADEKFKRIQEERHQRLADVIHASIREAGEAVPVDEAIAMLDSFFETGKVPTKDRHDNNSADDTP